MDMSCLPHDISAGKTFLFELILKFWKAGWMQNLNLRRMTSFYLHFLQKINKKMFSTPSEIYIACVKVAPFANQWTQASDNGEN